MEPELNKESQVKNNISPDFSFLFFCHTLKKVPIKKENTESVTNCNLL